MVSLWEGRLLAGQMSELKEKLNMDYERYYLDLLEMMNSSFRKIASGKYDKKDVERLFDLSKTGRYPHIFSEMAESFSMMMIKVEAREFHLKQLLSELKDTNTKI